MKNSNSWDSGLVLLAAVLWGTTGTAQAFAPGGASPLSIGSVRLVIGGLTLLLAALRNGSLKDKKLWINRNTFLSAIAVSAYQLFFFAGVLRTGVAMGTVVTIGSAPIFAGIISLFLHRKNPGLLWGAATLLSVAGCILLIGGGKSLTVNTGGIALNLAAGLSYAMYSALSKELLDSYSPIAVTGTVFTIGAIFLLPFLFLYDLGWLFTIRGSLAALHLGLLATALPYFLYTTGLSRIPFPQAVTLSLAEPVTAAILGIFILKEKLSPIALLGMVLVFSGLLVLSLGKRLFKPQPQM